MRPEERDAAYLLDMLRAARAVVSFVEGRSFSEYAADLVLRSAVERQIQIIGEAARHVSDTFRADHGEIPWRPIIAQRHRLVHEYGIVRDELMWKVATIHIPALIEVLTPLAPTEADE